MRTLAALALIALLGVVGPVPVAGATDYNTHLTRAPYLTDLVGLHVIVNFATDQTGTTASVSYGPFDGTTCTLPSSQSATRSTVTVGSLTHYQWKASLTLPSAGQYCYRVLLGGTDLLGTGNSPAFTTQASAGSTEPFSFAVFGDWGLVDANGDNQDQQNLLGILAGSGVRFAVTTGDNGYPSGSQTNYGDLKQVGAAMGAIFGARFWPVPGASVPLFTASGNHGLSGTAHADLKNWPQDVAVSSSGGRYENDVYCCVNGTTSTNYASAWYAFDAGPARFYVLTSAWGDTNPGTASVYANDYAAHFAPGTPEYSWLLADLQAHPSGLKFAFSHYPFYSDDKSQGSDTFLQGSSSLEGLLAAYGVNIAFNGHSHVYERNFASAPGYPITYISGGGGATLETIGLCHAFDAFGLGWSPNRLAGSSCGGAPVPTSATQVFHFIKVSVSGTTVTVAPTDELGRTFDVQTYSFANAITDTVIDSGPANPSNSSTATFSFHSTISPATFACAIDGGTPAPCASPVTYNGLADGSHSFSVSAAAASGTDPTPAVRTWSSDATAPTVPTSVVATPLGPSAVGLTWNTSIDTGGVAGYDITRDGVVIGSTGAAQTSYSDATAAAATPYPYAVRARDAAGNTSVYSTPAPVTTPAGVAPFQNGFEAGFTGWTSTGGLALQGTTVHSGALAAEGNTTNGATYAKKTVTAVADGYARVYFNLKSAASQVNLLRMRAVGSVSLGYAFVTASGQLGWRNDVTATTTMSSTVAGPGWHALELHLLVNGTTSISDVWLDGTRLADISSALTNLGTSPVSEFQIGEVQTGRTYDVVFDDAAFGSQRIGP
jgi:calcineurin-like phosphoesterase family protein